MSSPALESESSPDRVTYLHQVLRESILSGDIEPGAVLTQAALARDHNVSRTPLREALRLLQADGLVDVREQRLRVRPMSFDDLDDLYTMRITMESLGARITVPKMTPAHLEMLRSHLDAIDEFDRVGDFAQREVPHVAFHRGLVSLAGPSLVSAFDEYNALTTRYRRLQSTQPRAYALAAQEHRAILSACEAGDAEAAAQRLAYHLARVALTLVAELAPTRDPANLRTSIRFACGGHEVDPAFAAPQPFESTP
ncbi:GntR family transcriptional regulator [Geodermatophilus sp. CPCC 205761]|uniref:GntR family transcriptional regulator n=1 Tax=Geodermatophilus sp. CPCC 205761 TaxID=2936597 RepID=UPI003EEFD908